MFPSSCLGIPVQLPDKKGGERVRTASLCRDFEQQLVCRTNRKRSASAFLPELMVKDESWLMKVYIMVHESLYIILKSTRSDLE